MLGVQPATWQTATVDTNQVSRAQSLLAPTRDRRTPRTRMTVAFRIESIPLTPRALLRRSITLCSTTSRVSPTAAPAVVSLRRRIPRSSPDASTPRICRRLSPPAGPQGSLPRRRGQKSVRGSSLRSLCIALSTRLPADPYRSDPVQDMDKRRHAPVAYDRYSAREELGPSSTSAKSRSRSIAEKSMKPMHAKSSLRTEEGHKDLLCLRRDRCLAHTTSEKSYPCATTTRRHVATPEPPHQPESPPRPSMSIFNMLNDRAANGGSASVHSSPAKSAADQEVYPSAVPENVRSSRPAFDPAREQSSYASRARRCVRAVARTVHEGSTSPRILRMRKSSRSLKVHTKLRAQLLMAQASASRMKNLPRYMQLLLPSLPMSTLLSAANRPPGHSQRRRQ